VDSKVYLLLGSNLGDRRQHLLDALAGISYLGTIRKVSSVYRSAAWGNLDQPDFLNATVELDTVHSPLELLKAILDIETGMGRVRNEKWGARLIDIDILFYDSLVMNTQELVIPHPQLQNRKFTLVPLAEIAPGLVHPQLRKTVIQLLDSCSDHLTVEKEFALA
jgi:2-amino-4-hydroxy-6-hydroxymethyldihydropteridine diphosphokinase